MSKSLPLSSLWFLAFLSGLYFVNAWQMELFACAFLILVLFACFALSRDAVEGWSVPKAPVVALIGALWLLMFLSILWSGVPYVSLIGFCLSSILPLTFFTFAFSARGQDYTFVFRAVAVVLAGLALWALVQYYALNDLFDGQAKHPLANPNSLAALFNLGFFPALGVMLSTKDRRVSTGALIFAVLMFAGMTATTSRAAVLFCALTFVLFIALNPSVVKAHWKCLGILVLECVGLYFATALGERHDTQLVERMATFVTSAGDAYTVTGNRNNLWAGVWALIQDHWVTGTGIGTFFLYYPSYRIPQEVTGAYLAHSDPMQYWSELGLAGPVLFYAVGIAILIRTVRAVSKIEKGDVRRIQLLSIVAAIFVTMLHTHFTFNLYVVPVQFVTGFLLALWLKETQAVLKTPERIYAFPKQIPESYRAGFFIIPLVMLGALFASFMASEHFIKKAKEAAYDNDMRAFTRYVNLSDELSFGTNYRAYLLAVTVPISILEVNGHLMSDEEKNKVYAQAVSFLDSAERLNPVNPAVAYYRGYVQDFVDETALPEGIKSQEDYYRESLALNPLHVAARLALLKLYRDQNDMVRFEDALKTGLDWKYQSPQAQELFLEAQRYYILTHQFDNFKNASGKLEALQDRLKAAEKKRSGPLSQQMFGDE